jgi:predicted nucleic acid-binding protein
VIVLLDAGPLGLATNPLAAEDAAACNRWMQDMLAAGSSILVPEIADYEVRRELTRAGKVAGLRRLDALVGAVGYVPIDTATMRAAASFWAHARRQGKPTADDKALDCDVILAAQSSCLSRSSAQRVIIATTNVRHLTLFVEARRWQDLDL